METIDSPVADSRRFIVGESRDLQIPSSAGPRPGPIRRTFERRGFGLGDRQPSASGPKDDQGA